MSRESLEILRAFPVIHHSAGVHEHHFEIEAAPGGRLAPFSGSAHLVFACEASGQLRAEAPDWERVNFARCLAGEIEGFRVTDAGMVVRFPQWTEPRCGRCTCGEIVNLEQTVNQCTCGRTYWESGQLQLRA